MFFGRLFARKIGQIYLRSSVLGGVRLKGNTKKIIASVLLPILLIAGLLTCVIIYQVHTTEQLETIVYTEIETWTRNQSRLFASSAEGRLNALEALAKAFEDVPEEQLSLSKEMCENFGFSGFALAYEDDFAFIGGISPTNYAESLHAGASLSRRSAWLSQANGTKSSSLVAYSVPARTASGKNAALIGFCLSITADTELAASSADEEADSVVFAKDGTIIAHSGHSHRFTTGDNLFTYLFGSEEESELEKQIFRDEESGSLSYNFMDRSEYAAYISLDLSDWYLMTIVDGGLIKERITASTKLAAIASVSAFLIGAAMFAIIIIRTRSRRKEVENEQRERINALMIDELTGLYTSQGFEYAAKSALEKLPEDKLCAVISFEVLSFRSFNALYGFDKGDALLKDIAGESIKNSNQGEVLGHLFADRFVWLMYDTSIDAIKERLTIGYYHVREQQMPFFLCAGIYEITDRSVDVSTMVDKASIAKETIKGNYTMPFAVYNDSMLNSQLEDAELVAGMMKGIANGEFVDFYQAKYRTDSETVAGAEALVRWRKPNGELIAPGRFIDLFEKNGFIRKLDLYMLDRVCHMLRDRMDKGEDTVPVSVNFSRVHIYDPAFPETVIGILNKYGVSPEHIEIELTESAFLAEADALNDAVERLHSFGLSVAIDDFGSGYSSLNMLKDVPVDVLKIDMRFLEGFERGGKVGTVVTSVVRMAKWLGVPVVAEGVETKAQVDFLRSLGCDMVQGYYFARPIPRGDFEKLLDSEDGKPAVKEESAEITLESINAVLGGDSLLTSLMDGIVGGFGLYELSGSRLEAIRVNKGYYELMGYPDMASFGTASFNVADKVYPADQELFLNACHAAAETGVVQSLSIRRFNYSGAVMRFKGLIKHIGGSVEKPLLCITFLDATETLKAERERELNKYSEALYGIYDEIYEFNYQTNAFRLLSSNKVRHSEKNIPLDKAEKKWFNKVVYSEDRLMIEGFTEELKNGTIKLPFTEEFRINTVNGVRWVSASIVSVSENSYLLCGLDITEKKEVEAFVQSMEGLHQRMELDMTTGVLSPDTSESFIRERLRLDDTSSIAALMLFSVENIQAVSGGLGKVTANAFLKECAQRIKTSFKEQDVVGRFRDDKFIVLMSGIATASIALTKAIKAQSAVNEIALPDNLKVDCRVGISLVVPGNRDYDAALEKTCAALRQAQANTVNRCVMYEDRAEQ